MVEGGGGYKVKLGVRGGVTRDTRRGCSLGQRGLE